MSENPPKIAIRALTPQQALEYSKNVNRIHIQAELIAALELRVTELHMQNMRLVDDLSAIHEDFSGRPTPERRPNIEYDVPQLPPVFVVGKDYVYGMLSKGIIHTELPHELIPGCHRWYVVWKGLAVGVFKGFDIFIRAIDYQLDNPNVGWQRVEGPEGAFRLFQEKEDAKEVATIPFIPSRSSGDEE